MATLDELLQDAGRRMDKSVESTRHELNSIRTGRASPALLDRIHIDYYGQVTPLNQMAQIGAPESRLLTIQPYDPSQIKAIEKAIAESDLGLTPSNDGKVIRLPIPRLTAERRRGGQGRRPQRAPRPDEAPRGAGSERRSRRRRGAARRGRGPEADGRP